MVSFTADKISLDAEAISMRLKSEREKRKLKIRDIAKRLNTNYNYLEALENNEFWKLPKGVYGRKILQEYAIFLRLDHKEMLDVFEKGMADGAKEKEKQMFSAQVVKNSYFLAIPRIFRNAVIGAIVVICFAYLGYRLDRIVSEPFLLVSAPADNLITTEKTIEVSGITDTETQIAINGELVLSDTRGAFSKEVDLKKGINVITVTAKKKYGRENTVQRQILVKEGELQL